MDWGLLGGGPRVGVGAGISRIWWESLLASTMMMVTLHVLQSDTAPHPDHERLNLTLVLPAGDTEQASLAPVLAPGVGSNLEYSYSLY